MLYGPLSSRVRRLLEERIESGIYAEGTKLPGETELAKQIGVSRVTLRETLKELEIDGLIHRQHGIGTFVAQQIPKVEYKIEDNLGAVEMIERSGLVQATTQTDIDDKFYDPEIGAIFGEPKMRFVTVRRIRAVRGRPIVSVLDALPWQPNINFSIIEKEDLTVFEFLRRELGIVVGDGKAVLVPKRATKRVADDLKLPQGSLVMVLEQVDFQKNGRPMLYSMEWWTPNLVKFTATRRRPAVAAGTPAEPRRGDGPVKKDRA
jgi:GntR family transcriptional regulator